MYVCMYVCVHVCMCVRDVCMCMCMCMCMYIYIYVYVCVCVSLTLTLTLTLTHTRSYLEIKADSVNRDGILPRIILQQPSEKHLSEVEPRNPIHIRGFIVQPSTQKLDPLKQVLEVPAGQRGSNVTTFNLTPTATPTPHPHYHPHPDPHLQT